jgi:hypothetical protein
MISTSSVMSRTALIGLGCALSIAVGEMSVVKAADPARFIALSDEAPSLPVSGTFEKVTDADAGPYVLKLKNDSTDAIELNAKVLASVVSHGTAKERDIPAHTVNPGEVWSIPDLAAGDKVTVSAKGFAPLELTVP